MFLTPIGAARTAALLLAVPGFALVSTGPVAAATPCDSADTTWLGTPDGSLAWADDANWSNGVPTATSAVCIPYTDGTGPRVLEGTQAQAQVVTLEGTLTVNATLDVATLVGEYGELHGPGTTTVADGITGRGLTFRDGAVVDLPQDAVLGGELHVWDGSRLNVLGDALLEDGASIESFVGPEGPGYFTVAATGTLTIDSPSGSAEVYGGFANHGEVHVLAGWLRMEGAGDVAPTGQFSDGSFTASPDATLTLAYTEMRTGARVDHATWVDHINVPAQNSVTIGDSTLTDFDGGPDDPAGPPSFTGAGELVVTNGTVLAARIGDSLSVTVPTGEVVNVAGTLRDRAHLEVNGEAIQIGDLYLDDEAVLDIYGTHKIGDGYAIVDFSGTDPGVEVIHPGGQLSGGGPNRGLVMVAPFVNDGTVDSATGFIYLGPRSASPSPSSGTFRADPQGTLLLGSNVGGEPPLELNQPVIEGTVQVDGPVFANSPQIRGHLSTLPGGADTRSGQLTLSGTTTLTDGASVVGDVHVEGTLEADLGATGRATLSGAEVNGQVHVTSGTLEVQSLAPTTLRADGTLTSGEWIASLGATLDLPAVTTIDASLLLMDPGSTFGDGLATLTGVGPNGTLLLGGADLAVPGLFRNEGDLYLFSGSRLDVGGKFGQRATGTLCTYVDSAGRGRVRAAGPRNLAGKLVIQRDAAYKPPVGTLLNFITSAGATSPDDAFDSVTSPRYGTHKQLRPAYDTNHVRLRVDRVG